MLGPTINRIKIHEIFELGLALDLRTNGLGDPRSMTGSASGNQSGS